MPKKKKSINRRSPSPSSSPEMNVNLELDIKALRGKNKQLIQAVAKLQQEKAVQLTQMTTLQEEFFKLNSKYVNLKNIFSTIDATTKVCFPKQLELVNTFGKIMQLCAVGATVSNLNKDPKTQAVKPHNVNGHVLQNPTITLSRFNNSDSRTPPRRSSGRNSANNSDGNDLQPSPVRHSNNLNLSHVNSRPGTSRVPVSNDSRLSTQEIDMDDANLSDRVQGLVPVVSRTVNLARLNMSDMSEDVEEGVDTPEEDEDISDPDYNGRLVTIQEEEEEAYNSTLRSINTSQTAFSDRVREIRIFLDPLPTDCIGRSENIEDFVNRTSSLVGEPSTSVLDPNNTLLNDSLSSPEDTMKFITSARGSRNFCFKTSPPTKNNSSFFGEASCSSSRVDDDVNKIQVLRGQYHKAAVDVSQKFEYESTASMSEDSSIILPVKLGSITNCFSNISAIHNLGGENTFNQSTSVELDNSKINTMKSLGLEPKNLRLTTSTPVAKSPRTSSRIKKMSIPLNSSKKKSPVDSKVTKRRGGSDDKKMAQVIVKRLSLERRLSSGSPIKKIGELLNTPPITKASQIRKVRPKGTKQKTQISESNMDSDSSEQDTTSESNRKKNIRSKTVKGKTKGKENRQNKTPTPPLRSSPRPKRAAKPTQLKEPSLNKKMRRSR